MVVTTVTTKNSDEPYSQLELGVKVEPIAAVVMFAIIAIDSFRVRSVEFIMTAIKDSNCSM